MLPSTKLTVRCRYAACRGYVADTVHIELRRCCRPCRLQTYRLPLSCRLPWLRCRHCPHRTCRQPVDAAVRADCKLWSAAPLSCRLPWLRCRHCPHRTCCQLRRCCRPTCIKLRWLPLTQRWRLLLLVTLPTLSTSNLPSAP